MHLKYIKLAGFKSFVDPTTIPIQSQLCGIVGPNGCGKSNVVDAIRWVIGESSAKQLRGQSMADVIFNGTNARKPVGRASVELAFDNSDGRLGGEFAKYNEVSIRREVERDGQSNYFINSTRCRRRDILDLFLGTGLGQHSYAIIEQGMISQIIEAKPNDIRVFLEEAAGISVYKERRKDTESRIQRTQENLDRLNDLRDELERQLRHLKRQANSAERYNELKTELHLLQAQMKGLQWKHLDDQYQRMHQEILEKSTSLEEYVSMQRNDEAQIETIRIEQYTQNELQQSIQKNYYDLGVEITRIEEQLHNSQKQIDHWQRELNDIQNQSVQLAEGHDLRQQQIEEIKIRAEESLPQREEYATAVDLSKTTLLEAENRMENWQQQWQQLQQETSQVNQQKEIFKLKIGHHQQELLQLKDRIERMENSLQEKSFVSLDNEIQEIQLHSDEIRAEFEQAQIRLQELTTAIQTQRQHNESFNTTLKEFRNQLHTLEKEHASLNAVQQNALGENHQHIKDWLSQHQLQTQPLLGKIIHVEQGWEIAVETVLHGYMDAICIPDLSSQLVHLEQLPQGKLTLITQEQTSSSTTHQQPSLISKVKCEWSITPWLSQIYIAETLTDALGLQPSLQPHESIITRNGIWLGKNWARVIKTQNNDSGILVREQALKQLSIQITDLQPQIEELDNQLIDGQQNLSDLERQKEHQGHTYQELNTQWNQIQTQITAKQSRFKELQNRHYELKQELENCSNAREIAQQSLAENEIQLQEIQITFDQKESAKQQLLTSRDQNRQMLETAKLDFQLAQQEKDDLELQIVTDRKQLQVLEQTLIDSARQIEQLKDRENKTIELIAQAKTPIPEQSEQLQKLLNERFAIENQLKQVQTEQEHINQSLKQLERNREQVLKNIQDMQNTVQELQLKRQDTQTRQSTLLDQIQEIGFELNTLLENITQETTIENWEDKIATTSKQIERLGPINLAAIEEYKTVAERKEYLDKQLADLNEALSVLEKAMQKIDRESQSRFDETFTRINDQFQLLFPKIFGGGKAYLELLPQENSLESGILVRAQPPGKRNTTIHVLSGGEKALTAMAFLFAMFQLNPAPFCILDEVDAPLDDANVGRFCQLVKEMSAQIQFIFISHNKTTIATASQLMGVTMQEPGVSRIVSVNVDEAIEMAG